jgi:hypothetical protein
VIIRSITSPKDAMQEQGGATMTITDDTSLPVPTAGRGQVSTLDQLADIPEEQIWLQKPKEREDPARLPARRTALHEDARYHDAGGAAPGRPQGSDRLGTRHARDRARRGLDHSPAARGTVLAL